MVAKSDLTYSTCFFDIFSVGQPIQTIISVNKLHTYRLLLARLLAHGATRTEIHQNFRYRGFSDKSGKKVLVYTVIHRNKGANLKLNLKCWFVTYEKRFT